MSIKTIITCDGKDCKNTLDISGPVFKFKIVLEDEGWTIKKENDEWKHFCPDHK